MNHHEFSKISKSYIIYLTVQNIRVLPIPTQSTTTSEHEFGDSLFVCVLRPIDSEVI